LAVAINETKWQPHQVFHTQREHRPKSLQMKHRVVAGKFWVNVDPRTRGLVLVTDMSRNIFYIIGVIVVIVIVLKVLGLF
jgi:hypothetical protein